MTDSIHQRRITASDSSRGRSSRTRHTAKNQVSRRIPTKFRSKSTKILNRSFSDPNLHQSFACKDDDNQRCSTPVIDLPAEESEQIIYLSKIHSEVFASTPSLSGFSSSSSSSSPINKQVYKREAAKVVISVSAEGDGRGGDGANLLKLLKYYTCYHRNLWRSDEQRKRLQLVLHNSDNMSCLDNRIDNS